MLRISLGISFAGLITLHAADSLYFTSGSVSNYENVSLSLAGPNNLVVEVQRLNPTNDVWEAQGTTTLASGTGTFTNSLIQGIYGFFRAKGTNNPGTTNAVIYYSTNGFGAVAGTLNPGTTPIGNIFAEESITNILPDAPYGTQVYKYDNAASQYDIYLLDDLSGTWEPGVPTINETEGFLVRNNDTNSFRYLISGLFTTNTVSTTIPQGLSLIATPLYHIIATNTWRVDTFDTNALGGASLIPVQSSGFNPQCTLLQAITTGPTYQTNILTSANLWQSNGTNVVVHIGLTEGFWLDKPTNATWNINRPLW